MYNQTKSRLKDVASGISISTKGLFLLFPVILTAGLTILSATYILLLFGFFIKDVILLRDVDFIIKPAFPIFFLLLWGIFTIYLTADYKNGIYYYYGTIFTPILVFLIIQNIDLDAAFLQKFYDLLILSAVFISLIAIYIFIQSGFNSTLRIVAIWESINIVAAYLMVIFMFNLSLLLNKKKGENKLLYIASIFIIFFGIFLTQTRGVWMGTVFAIIVYFVRRPKVLIPALLLIASFMFLFYNAIVTRVLTVKNYKGDWSSLGRLQAWIATVLLLKNNFFIGNGFDSFMQLRDNVIGIYLVEVPHSHNTYLRSLLEIGFIGSIIYYYFFFYAGYLSIKMHNLDVTRTFKQFTDGLELSFIALAVTFFFEPYFSMYGNSSIFIWTLIAFSFKINTLLKNNKKSESLI